MVPAPAAVQVPPPEPLQVQVGVRSAAGGVSCTVAPVTFDGPGFETTIVYVIACPGCAAPRPSLLVMARSAWGVRVSVSVLELLAALGSVTPAGTLTVAVF